MEFSKAFHFTMSCRNFSTHLNVFGKNHLFYCDEVHATMDDHLNLLGRIICFAMMKFMVI